MNKAFSEYQRASEMGNSDAIFKLGYCYENGYGVERDLHKAVEMYRTGADKG